MAEKIKLDILIINSLDDSVVDPSETKKMSDRIQNSKNFRFLKVVCMKYSWKKIYIGLKMWKGIDDFLINI